MVGASSTASGSRRHQHSSRIVLRRRRPRPAAAGSHVRARRTHAWPADCTTHDTMVGSRVLNLPPMAAAHWRCAWCRCTWKEACERAEREGRSLRSDRKTCSPECSRIQSHAPRTARAASAWRCEECGCARSTAERRRRAQGLPPLFIKAVVCSPECGRARHRRVDGRKYPPPRVPPRPPGPWRCEVCGCDEESARRRRAVNGFSKLRSTARVCTPECAERRARALAIPRTPSAGARTRPV
jgi:hypothetical protein